MSKERKKNLAPWVEGQVRMGPLGRCPQRSSYPACSKPILPGMLTLAALGFCLKDLKVTLMQNSSLYAGDASNLGGFVMHHLLH